MRQVQQDAIAAISRSREQKARAYLDTLCAFQPSRSLGSPGNKEATDFIARIMRQYGFEIDTTPFECLDFESGASRVVCGGRQYDLFSSPYSNGCNFTAELATASTIEELARSDCTGKILLLKGELCAEQLMPKNYPFYYPDHHRAIHALLEAKQPAAIIAATVRNPAMVGGMYPYPLIEDGNFDIPSAYCTDVLGEEIAAHAGKPASITIGSRRIPSTASNVIASRHPDAARKVVIMAHLDTKATTPGALDNASGVVVLMLLAELLEGYDGSTGIELVAINGEENYRAAGEMDYLDRYGDDMGRVALAINIDGAGYIEGKTGYSYYGCPEDLLEKTDAVFGQYDGLTDGPQWFQGDHTAFVQRDIPAIAFTSEQLTKLFTDIVHTPKDVPALVDCGKIVELAEAIGQLIVAGV